MQVMEHNPGCCENKGIGSLPTTCFVLRMNAIRLVMCEEVGDKARLNVDIGVEVGKG